MKTHYITPTFRLTAPDTCCVFCKHCLHYLWDYSNGIYSIVCGIEANEEDGWAGECNRFEYDGGKGEREPTEEEVKAHTEYLNDLVEFCKQVAPNLYEKHKAVLDKNKAEHFPIDK